MSDSEKSAHYNWLDRSAVRVRFDAHPYGARANPGFDPLRNKKAGQTCFFIVNGGAEGDRTLDLLIANQSLSQLSYSPKRNSINKPAGPPVRKMVELRGIEPLTS